MKIEDYAIFNFFESRGFKEWEFHGYAPYAIGIDDFWAMTLYFRTPDEDRNRWPSTLRFYFNKRNHMRVKDISSPEFIIHKPSRTFVGKKNIEEMMEYPIIKYLQSLGIEIKLSNAKVPHIEGWDELIELLNDHWSSNQNRKYHHIQINSP